MLCSYCHSYSHNIRGCPLIDTNYKKIKVIYKDAVNKCPHFPYVYFNQDLNTMYTLSELREVAATHTNLDTSISTKEQAINSLYQHCRSLPYIRTFTSGFSLVEEPRLDDRRLPTLSEIFQYLSIRL